MVAKIEQEWGSGGWLLCMLRISNYVIFMI